jgi:hypothetical protein
VGDQLYKRSLRTTGLTAAVSLLGYLGGLLPGFDTYNAKVAIALPLLIGASMLLGGFMLKTIPTLLASRAMNVAEAQDLDLMEDYRKSQVAEHLEVLWQRVFRFEWAVGSAVSRIREHPVEAPPELCLAEVAGEDPQERGRREFLARARFALARPQSQPCQRYYLGIDLRFLEDWYNGAYFDRQDMKLVEQFNGSATLAAVRREIGSGHWNSLEEFSLKLFQKFWFKMITRAIAIHVGDAVTSLNRRFGTDYFNAQALLWPGEDEAAWAKQFPLAGDDIRERRRAILDDVFGEEPVTARRMLRRMLWPGCWLASKLRAAYDPEYVTGGLGCDLVSDLEAIYMPPGRVAPLRELARQVEADQSALASWLCRYRPELARPEFAESLRSARIAVHLRRDRLRPFLQANVEDRQAGEAFVDNVLDRVDEAVRARERYTARLVALRIHHELTRLHYQEYLRLLDQLR